jgi:hypothetical protein
MWLFAILFFSVVSVALYMELKTKKRAFRVLNPEDFDKDFKDVKSKMDHLYLDLSKLKNIKDNVDHINEINTDIDGYMSNMHPFLVRLSPELTKEVNKKRFVHVGYAAWGDFFGRDGLDLYASKKWVKDVVRATNKAKGKSKWYRLGF